MDQPESFCLLVFEKNYLSLSLQAVRIYNRLILRRLHYSSCIQKGQVVSFLLDRLLPSCLGGQLGMGGQSGNH